MKIEDVQKVNRWVGNSQSWLSSFLSEAPSIPAIISVVIIGSAVRPSGHRRSDFDLLIIFEGSRPKLDAPTEIDVRLIAAKDVERFVSAGHEILAWALKFGVPVYDPNDVWFSLQIGWADRLPLPSATEAKRRATEALSRADEMLEAGDNSAADDLLLAALTQFVREQLIGHGIFPASRPELPRQLREVAPVDGLAELLEDAMYKEESPATLRAKLADRLKNN